MDEPIHLTPRILSFLRMAAEDATWHVSIDTLLRSAGVLYTEMDHLSKSPAEQGNPDLIAEREFDEIADRVVNQLTPEQIAATLKEAVFDALNEYPRPKVHRWDNEGLLLSEIIACEKRREELNRNA